MNLLVISHGFPPYYGGAEHAAGFLAQAAADTGRWKVRVLTSDIGGRLSSHEEHDGVCIDRVRCRKAAWTGHTTRELVSFLCASRSYRPPETPDLILAHFTLPAGTVARGLSRLCGVPYAVVLHGSDVPGYQTSRFGLLYRIIKPWIRRIWRDAGRVIAVSEELRALALDTWPGGRIDVVPNGVDTVAFRPADAMVSEPASTSVRMVSTAQLIPRKGLQHVIAAIASLPSSAREHLTWTIYGTGAYGDTLRELVASQGLADVVSLGGLVDYEELPDRLRDADLFVLPSLQEGLPLSLLEAMACGLPVLATRVGGIPRVVVDGEHGLLVEPGDPARLADALLRLINDSRLREVMGRAGHHAAQSWSWAAVWQRYERVLAPLTSSSPSGRIVAVDATGDA
jgi:glycosyltransferase involved in cell wall biosynthesis